MKIPRIQFSLRTLVMGTLGAGVFLLLLPPFAIPVFSPWSEINCSTQEINIRTGQARYRSYFWYRMTSETVRPTPLSEALAGEAVNAAPIDAWHMVSTLDFATGHSPNYRFHGALYQAHEFKKICEMHEIPAECRTEIAREMLYCARLNNQLFRQGEKPKFPPREV